MDDVQLTVTCYMVFCTPKQRAIQQKCAIDNFLLHIKNVIGCAVLFFVKSVKYLVEAEAPTAILGPLICQAQLKANCLTCLENQE